MNVYTHVEMRDLAADLESLPPLVGGEVAKEAVGESESETGKDASVGEVAKPDASAPLGPPSCEASEQSPIPAALASVADSWNSLPEHVRKAIATLARV